MGEMGAAHTDTDEEVDVRQGPSPKCPKKVAQEGWQNPQLLIYLIQGTPQVADSRVSPQPSFSHVRSLLTFPDGIFQPLATLWKHPFSPLPKINIYHCMIKYKSSQVILPGLEAQLCHVTAVWLDTSYITSLSLFPHPSKSFIHLTNMQ